MSRVHPRRTLAREIAHIAGVFTEKPMEYLYDRIGQMLSLPPQQGAPAVVDRAPDGFHKLKIVAECLDSGGNVRSRRISAAIPAGGGEATHARVKWEKDGAFTQCMPLSPNCALC